MIPRPRALGQMRIKTWGKLHIKNAPAGGASGRLIRPREGMFAGTRIGRPMRGFGRLALIRQIVMRAGRSIAGRTNPFSAITTTGETAPPR